MSDGALDGNLSGTGGGAGGRGGGRRRGGFDRPVIDLGQMFDRLPPNSVDAERSLLGAILLDPRILTEVVPIVSSGTLFYKEAHGAIFQALLDTYEAHQSGDLVQLVESLRGRGILDQVGGPKYLMDLSEAVPSAAAAPHYARIVSDTARLRRLIDAAGEILYKAYHEGSARPDAAKAVVDEAEKLVFDIAQEKESVDQQQLAELLHEVYEQIERAKDENRPITGIATGFDDLDEKLSGLQPGEMIVLAARPSMGKTAMALNIAEQVAFAGRTPWSPRSTERVPVGFFSLEMSRKSLVQRLLSARSGIDAHELRTGRISNEDFARLSRACDDLRDLPLHIDDTPGMTVLQLRAKARRMVQRHKIRCVIVDYLQLLTSPTAARESRQVEVSEISRSIKALARELSVPVVCLAQLNRGTEQREGNRPRMSDLRESGSIEQDADVVMLLHRESYYHRGDPAWDPRSPEFNEENREKLDLTELIVAKQRNGPTGTVRLTWDDGITRFKNRDHMHAGGGGGHGGFPGESRPGGSSGRSPGGSRGVLGGASGPRATSMDVPFDDAPFESGTDDGPAVGRGTGGGRGPAAGIEVKDSKGPDAGLPEAGKKTYTFAAGKKTGPAANHRDGGGPDRHGGSFGSPAGTGPGDASDILGPTPDFAPPGGADGFRSGGSFAAIDDAEAEPGGTEADGLADDVFERDDDTA
jgi:replicative DNA helicase